MVLQDKYSRAASRKYQRTHTPTPEQAAEHAAVDAAIREVERRRLGTNADRYREDDEQKAREEGAATLGPDGQPLPATGEEEVDEEEELRKAEEQAELEAFLEQQRTRLQATSGDPKAGFTGVGDEEEDDDEDVDHSFAHLRIGGSAKGKPRPVGLPATATEEEKEERRRMQDEARHRQAVRDLKDRFAGTAPQPQAAPPRQVPGTAPSLRNPAAAPPRSFSPTAPKSAASLISLPPKKGVQPAAKGQDFLDTLL